MKRHTSEDRVKAGRPDLFCRYCCHVWQPKGTNRSKVCPKCGKANYAPPRTHLNTLDKFFED